MIQIVALFAILPKILQYTQVHFAYWTYLKFLQYNLMWHTLFSLCCLLLSPPLLLLIFFGNICILQFTFTWSWNFSLLFFELSTVISKCFVINLRWTFSDIALTCFFQVVVIFLCFAVFVVLHPIVVVVSLLLSLLLLLFSI